MAKTFRDIQSETNPAPGPSVLARKPSHNIFTRRRDALLDLKRYEEAILTLEKAVELEKVVELPHLLPVIPWLMATSGAYSSLAHF